MDIFKIKACVVEITDKRVILDDKAVAYPKLVLETLTGQKAVIITARKSIAAFRLRKGIPVGCKVTLRGKNLRNLLKLLTVIFPHFVFNRSNCSFGIKDASIFPVIDFLEQRLQAPKVGINFHFLL